MGQLPDKTSAYVSYVPKEGIQGRQGPLDSFLNLGDFYGSSKWDFWNIRVGDKPVYVIRNF